MQTADGFLTPETLAHFLENIDRTAAHEAGHVVAGLYYGQTPSRITMGPQPDRAEWGCVFHGVSTAQTLMVTETTTPEVLEAGRASARREMVICAAGIAAERALGFPAPDGDEDGGEGDRETAGALARFYFGDAAAAGMEAADAAAAAIFARPGGAAMTAAVADALREAALSEVTDILGADLDAILQAAEEAAPGLAGAGVADFLPGD